MDGSRIQAKVNRGYAIAASRLGLPHAHFRPLGPGAALDAANRLPRDLPAAFEPNWEWFNIFEWILVIAIGKVWIRVRA